MLYLSLLLLLAQGSAAFRTEVRVVRVDAEVRHDGRLVDDLTQKDFRVSDGGRPQEILYFGHSDESLDLVLLFDTSASMLPAIAQVAEVSRLALGELRPDDRVALMAFDADTDLVADFSNDLGAVHTSIRERVLTREFVPNSQIQRAVADAARHFLAGPPGNRRRAVLVVTDNIGSSNDPRALPLLWEADTVLTGLVVPGMAVVRRQRLLFPPSWFGFGGVDEIARKTGGDTLKANEVGDGFRQLIQRLRRRYSLHYLMPEARPGEERRIKVELTPEAARIHRGARVHARSGYTVPER